jgi:UDP-N-acetylmuramoyl-L-alanyl-D-glutamate--2,6-diaminopimelate ligase
MAAKRAAEILRDVPLGAAAGAIVLTGLAYDSRRVEAGNLFAAWAGGRHDGHAHVGEAVARGAGLILCERPVDAAVPVCVVRDVRRTLAEAARQFFDDPASHLRMVGITGTNGKTTTAHLVESVLAAAGVTPGIIGTLGLRYGGLLHETGLTTPESVDLVAALARMKAAGIRGVAMEVSSQALAQRRVAGVRYDVGVFTNLTQDHLDYHGTLDAYFAAKAELFHAYLKAGGVGVLNLDDARVASLAGPGRLGFSRRGAPDAAIRLASCALGVDGIRLEAQTPRGRLAVRSPLVGAFNVENILAALGVGLALELPTDAICRGIEALACVPGRLERVSRAGEPLVLVDYAHTPDALEKALAVVREVTPGRVFCVFGCGGDRDPTKRAPMGRAAAGRASWSVLTNDNPRREAPEAIAAAVEEGLRAAGAIRSATPVVGGYWVELDRRRAIAHAVAAATPEDAVLVAGKGHEAYQIVGGTKHAFDDRHEARAALDARGETHA